MTKEVNFKGFSRDQLFAENIKFPQKVAYRFDLAGREKFMKSLTNFNNTNKTVYQKDFQNLNGMDIDNTPPSSSVRWINK